MKSKITCYYAICLMLLPAAALISCTNKNTTQEITAVKNGQHAGTPTDTEFIIHAAASNWINIQFSQLAQTKTNTAAVRELSKKVEEDHSAYLKELQALALKKHIDLPATSLTTLGLEAYKDFFQKTGTDFDTAYCSLMINGYKEAIDQFEKVTVTASDYDTRYWARNVIPALKANLDYAINCQKIFIKIPAAVHY